MTAATLGVCEVCGKIRGGDTLDGQNGAVMSLASLAPLVYGECECAAPPPRRKAGLVPQEAGLAGFSPTGSGKCRTLGCYDIAEDGGLCHTCRKVDNDRLFDRGAGMETAVIGS